MRVHRASAGPRIVLDVRVRIELPEEFVERGDAEGEHQGLVAVVAGAPVALAECARPCELRDFLAVAENAELRLAGEHFLAADEAGLPAAHGDAIVVDDRFARELRARLRFGCRHVELRCHGFCRWSTPEGGGSPLDEILAWRDHSPCAKPWLSPQH